MWALTSSLLLFSLCKNSLILFNISWVYREDILLIVQLQLSRVPWRRPPEGRWGEAGELVELSDMIRGPL